MMREVPQLAGVLTREQVAQTAAAIATVQEADGAIPWTAGDQVDAWNHIEAAMALVAGGEVDAAHAAYDWCLSTQRADGSWPMRLRGGEVVDAATESNMCAYLAVGVWHHWLVRADKSFVQRMWPSVQAGLDVVAGMQLPAGGIAWARGVDGGLLDEALLTGSSSIYHALVAGLAIADLIGEQRPDWEIAGGRLQHAVRSHPDAFADKSTFSMDWYYPVLGGALRGDDGAARIASRWDDFVVQGLGARCVSPNPWVTGAETCELALALDCLGDSNRAISLVRDMQHLRADDGGYWTGYVYADDAIWPEEHTTYTSAAVILAADALSNTTGGAGIFRGTGLRESLPEFDLTCTCALSRP